MSEPLHAMNPQGRFTGLADDYSRFRPDYPLQLIGAIVECTAARRPLVADLGAGTGIASRQLADSGARVIAIEPNQSMRRSARPHGDVRWIDGSAERIPLAAAAVDVAAAFQAFHWFDPARALPEIYRILRREGQFAVAWNERDPDDPFTAAYGTLVRHLSGDHPAERRAMTIEPLLASTDFSRPIERSFSHAQSFDFDGLIGRARSTSYIPKGEETDRELRSLFDKWNEKGRVTMRYRSLLYLAKKR